MSHWVPVAPATWTCTRLLEGTVGTNYKIHDHAGNVFVLTEHDGPTVEQLETVGQLVNVASETVPVGRWERVSGGENFVWVENGQPYTVQRWVHGWAVTPTAASCASVGRWLGTLHTAPAPSGPVCKWLHTPPAEQAHVDPPGWIQSAWEDLHRCENSVAQLPFGLCHGDPFVDNFVNTPRTGMVGIDWSTVNVDVFAADVALALLGWCVDSDGVFEPKLATAMLVEYNHVRKFSIEEFQTFPTLFRAVGAAVAWQRLVLTLRQGDFSRQRSVDQYVTAELSPTWLEHVRKSF